MSVVNYCEASSVVLVTLHEMLSASQFLNSDLRTSENCYFKIERVLKSELPGYSLFGVHLKRSM